MVSSPACVLLPHPMQRDNSTSAARTNGYTVPQLASVPSLGLQVIALSSNGRSKTMSSSSADFIDGFVVQPVGSAASIPLDQEVCVCVCVCVCVL